MSSPMDTNLRGYLADLIRDGFDSEACAKTFLDEHQIPAKAAEMLRPLLVAEANAVRTASARAASRRIFVPEQARATINPLEMKRALAAESFALGDGTWVSYLQATAEQHEARADMLRRQLDGIERSALVHERCASVIRVHGVTCLAEVPDDARPVLS